MPGAPVNSAGSAACSIAWLLGLQRYDVTRSDRQTHHSRNEQSPIRHGILDVEDSCFPGNRGSFAQPKICFLAAHIETNIDPGWRYRPQSKNGRENGKWQSTL
jgi:hypothetical protein